MLAILSNFINSTPSINMNLEEEKISQFYKQFEQNH
jgi:hypothetical protein